VADDVAVDHVDDVFADIRGEIGDVLEVAGQAQAMLLDVSQDDVHNDIAHSVKAVVSHAAGRWRGTDRNSCGGRNVLDDSIELSV
jgi:hypothetical protein